MITVLLSLDVTVKRCRKQVKMQEVSDFNVLCVQISSLGISRNPFIPVLHISEAVKRVCNSVKVLENYRRGGCLLN